MQVGTLVRLKWKTDNRIGLVTGNATPAEWGSPHWCIEWVGEMTDYWRYSIEDERHLEVLCE